MTASCLLVFIFLPPLQAFPRLSGERLFTRAGDKREAQEGDDGNEGRPRAGSDGKENERKGFFSPSHHSVRPSFP